MKKISGTIVSAEKNTFYVVICNALIFSKYKKMVNELNIYSYIPQVDLPWLSSCRTETLRMITASPSLPTNQRYPSNNFSHATSQSALYVWLSLRSFRRAPWFQWSDSAFVSVNIVLSCIKFIPIFTGRPDLNNLNSPQLFIIISFIDRLGHL